ncbi:unnamed protein product, partial [Closterium sp. NIES-53]
AGSSVFQTFKKGQDKFLHHAEWGWPTIGLSEAQQFNGNNYSTWRLKFIRRAREVDLWPLYKADEETEEGVPPPATATAQEKMTYQKKSLQAFFQLCHSVSDSIAVGLDQFADDINSAQRAWAYMEAVYLGRTDTNLTAVRKKLLLLAMEPMEKIIDYVNRAKSYNDDLTAMGAPESEKYIMGYIISGLPKEWTAEIGILTCNTPNDLTQLLETLQALELVKSDLKRREAVATVAEENTPANLNATATPRIVGSCYHCGKKGHKAADYYSNPNASDCYNNKASRNYRGKELQQKPAAAKTNVMEVPAAVEVTTKVDAILGGAHKANDARASEVCLLSKGFKEKAWFMDSGCTQHMTHRADWLSDYRESGVPYILLGDERKLQVQGEGDLILQSPYGELKMDNVLLVEKLSLNLISQTQLDSSGCKTFSDNGKLWVFGPDWQLLAEGTRTQGLYQMKLKEQDSREDKVTYQPEPEEGKKAREELRTMLENTAVTELQQLKLPVAAAAEAVDINLLHKRMGHANTQRIKEMMKKNMAAGVKVTRAEETHMKCDSCVDGKATKAPHPRHGPKEPYGAMEVVAADVCGPMRVTSRHDSRYFITFTDIGTRLTWVTEIKDKMQVLPSFIDWLAEAERQSGKQLKVLRTDNGGEFINKEFNDYLKAKGIRRQRTIPHTPQHNSIAERVNRTLLNSVRSMLADRTCPESKGWIIKDVETGVVLATRDVTFYENLNYVDWKASNKGTTPGTAPATPQRAEELLEDAQNEGLGTANNEGEEDEEEHTQAGVDWVWEPTEDKLDNSDMEAAPTTPLLPKSASDIDGDIGEDEAEQADQSSTERKSDPWEFFETSNNDKGAVEIDNLLQDGAILIGREEGGTSTETAGEMAADTGASDASVKGEELGRGKRTKKPNLKYQQVLMTCWKDVHTHLLLTSTVTALITKERRETYKLPQEPLTIEEALSGPYKEQWKAAIQEELDALAERGTWKLVQMPEGRHVVGVKWIFKIKSGDKGQLERFKARLVAKGYTQVEGIDYTETYAPVSKLTTARTLFKIVAARNYIMVQLDIKNAFLYGELQEDIYMDQPTGLEDGTDRKCKLLKALYGLKQSPREWYRAMDARLLEGGFQKSQCDRAFYWKGEGEEKVYLLLYVDDILVAGALEDRVEEVCAHLAAVFQVKQIPRATLFLGMNLERDREGRKLLLYQKKYIQWLQERFGTPGCTKAVTTLLSSLSEKEINPEEELIQWGSKGRALKAYQSRIGSVMYPVSCTRVDVAHAASFLGQNVLQPEGRKWKEMQRTIAYLQQRGEDGLLYEGREETMEFIGYADASHASDKKDRKGAYGYVFLLGGTAITWQGKKLNDIALSSAEAEYMALFYAYQEGVWLRRLLQEMGVRVQDPTTIRSDSKSAIELAKNDNWHGRTKHMDIKYHWVREQLEKKAFTFEFVRTEDQAADFLTKVLPKANFERCKYLVGMRTLQDLQGSNVEEQ